MNGLTDHQDFIIRVGTKVLTDDHPEASAVVYGILDCGCIVLCCSSESGNPIGDMVRLHGRPLLPIGTFSPCIRCSFEEPEVLTIVRTGIVWVKPLTEKQKDFLSEKVLGQDGIIIKRTFSPVWPDMDALGGG